jgi:hypothetical protein
MGDHPYNVVDKQIPRACVAALFTTAELRTTFPQIIGMNAYNIVGIAYLVKTDINGGDSVGEQIFVNYGIKQFKKHLIGLAVAGAKTVGGRVSVFVFCRYFGEQARQKTVMSVGVKEGIKLNTAGSCISAKLTEEIDTKKR